MYFYRQRYAFIHQVLFFAATAGISVPATAGPGHDHGDETPAASASASPRVVAVSESFELVGVLNGKQITFYLDRADTNAPVKDAKLEVEFGGAKLTLESLVPGEFKATLAEAPEPGVIPVTATVIAGQDTDLLAGDLDLHDHHNDAKSMVSPGWKRYLPGMLGAGAVMGLLALATIWLRRRRSTFSVRTGGAK